MTIYLYIKIHNQTNLKYLGKTKQNPHTYKGSGKRWKNHLRKHGNDVSTYVIKEFSSNEELKVYSEQLSKQLNVVESNEWANLMLESGDGGPGLYNHEANKRNSVLGGYAKAAKKLPAWNKGVATGPESSEIRKKKSASHRGMKRSYRSDGSWFWIRLQEQAS
jgi:hypothetical protein